MQNTKLRLALILVGITIVITVHHTPSAYGQSFAPRYRSSETKAQRDQRMRWWREARFGMFIHWGLYAVPAGEYNGKRSERIGEWIMEWANIPRADYEKFTAQFNPVKFDAKEWVRIAKDAGMKYIVITSKHHDGFALYDSKVSKYDIVDATPYRKDPIKALAVEAKRQGLKFCFYYSILDWHYPAAYVDAPGKDPTAGNRTTKLKPGGKEEYLKYMQEQLRELISTYDPAVLWFDGEWQEWWTEADGKELYTFVRGLKPNIIINNRVGRGRQGMQGMSKTDQIYAGDFGTPEQQIPANGLPGVDWESCMTMNTTWGFKFYDDKWKSGQVLIRNLIDIASKGGNYLLNVGPTAEGLIPAPSVERLSEMGRWMKVNGEAIYGSTASPFVKQLAFGRATSKPGRVYLHVFDWPADGKLVVPAFGRDVKKAYVLATPKLGLNVNKTGDGILLTVPPQALDPIATVIVLETTN
ncbi:MAG TPA: alpha-L-fucosidase [Pyrinomonadaceae bacterium]|nr:alpha-L-fucosidase [Pyrinomonadaceae bacterium]